MNVLQVPLNENTAQQLQKLATAQGVSVEQEASRLLDEAIKRVERNHDFQVESAAFAASLPPQTTDSTDLIRQDRDHR